ncbi:MAG TPA: hypothetical protein VK837_10845 [Longimicrobiales bacterium]|nr:hypothetical protein [Longimicrobiales bacterium]
MNKRLLLAVGLDAETYATLTGIVNYSDWGILPAPDDSHALRLAVNHRPDLIVCYYKSNTMPGTSLPEQLARAGVSDLPVVAVIDRALPNLVSRLRRIGCRGYVVRPVRSAALKGTIERLAPAGPARERSTLPFAHT